MAQDASYAQYGIQTLGPLGPSNPAYELRRRMTSPLTLSSPSRTSGPADDVALASQGDRRAFERLYRTHVDRVFSVCVRMVGDRAQAEDLTQDVFVRCWEKLGQFRGDSAFSTWLHRLAVNVVLNDRQTAKRERQRVDDGYEDMDAIASGDVRPLPVPGLSLDLEAAIAALPAGARKVFVLHDVEGYTHEEIGTMLGVTAGGCKAQLHRARLLLRRMLTR
jgi:RNA polymerase sigma-70 factor (ECF subfamily)